MTMEPVEDGVLDLDFYAWIMEDSESTDLYLNDFPSAAVEFDAHCANVITQENGTRKRDRNDQTVRQGSKACREKMRRDKINKRDRNDQTVRQGSKACREKMRRDKINKRFTELSRLLESGRPAKTDKYALLDDVIRVLNQLKGEVNEFKEANTKLEEEIKILKEEKHELREEKSQMKVEKEKLEGCVKAMPTIPAGFVPPHPAAFHPGVQKMIAVPSYGPIPMWQFMPPAARDISKDNELRPPMA